MTIRKTPRGYELSAMIGSGIFCYKHLRHFEGYKRSEAIKLFIAEIKDLENV